MKNESSFIPVRRSLADLIGQDALDTIASARSLLSGEKKSVLMRRGTKKIEFYPRRFQERLRALLPQVGSRVSKPFQTSAAGATSKAFKTSFDRDRAPLSCLGYYRIGQDGRLYLISKSEHYHASLGHLFPGYELLDVARSLGVDNVTHNNTRGHITRVLEEALILTGNGLDPGDDKGLSKVLRSKSRRVLNGVLNLETGSLAAEAAIKMMLLPFHDVQGKGEREDCQGKIPVFVVMGDEHGKKTGNYHGTCMVAQILRGMWPPLARCLEKSGALECVAVRPNDTEGLEEVFRRYTCGKYRIAGFLHEIVMMNYGALTLEKAFLQRAYALCRRHNVPVFVDEIQTGIWCPDSFLFREYGLKPSFVAVGKGFPGGETPASRLLFSSPYDSLPQFGALVTNGQEEVASLAYLITMEWVRENGTVLREVGECYSGRVGELAAKRSDVVERVDGLRHMTSIFFHAMEHAKAFVSELRRDGLDVSVQSYKSDCPPSVLTKLPLIMGVEEVSWIVERMERALCRIR